MRRKLSLIDAIAVLSPSDAPSPAQKSKRPAPRATNNPFSWGYFDYETATIDGAVFHQVVMSTGSSRVHGIIKLKRNNFQDLAFGVVDLGWDQAARYATREVEIPMSLGGRRKGNLRCRVSVTKEKHRGNMFNFKQLAPTTTPVLSQLQTPAPLSRISSADEASSIAASSQLQSSSSSQLQSNSSPLRSNTSLSISGSIEAPLA